ncbi:hypothetical protein SAMN05660686_03504 [Thalassobaculum litoreum DSM 18839]|uniref:Uncharacterized protein n=1 Tax=Thalassobaculum litoreum DSM 18839 TaxID=1123362 RepID=A0A8G2BM20_9PROT|nr:hypothetical protein SAMN05660686_03504 [Thalassobaculum litoreum DSM 18839]
MKTAMEQTITGMPPALQRTVLTVGCAAATTLWAQILLVLAGG